MHNLNIELGPMLPLPQYGAQSLNVLPLLPELARRCPASLCKSPICKAPLLCTYWSQEGEHKHVPGSALYAGAGPECSLDQRKALRQLDMSVAAGMHHQQGYHSDGQVVNTYSSRV